MAPKKKQEKMTLGSFLSDQTYGSWAEEMDEMPLPSTGRSERPAWGSGGGERREFSSFGRDREFSDRGPPREQLPLPSKPPFTAHLGNLSFDVTMADVEGYFEGCDVTSVRIVEDKIERKPKGFGYVEFGTLDGLKKALELNGTQFQGRNIRISVADPPKDREPTREFNDWTRKGPLPELSASTRRPSGRGFDAGSDAGSDKGQRRAFEGDGRTRDFGNWERKGPLSPALTPTGPAGPGAGPGAGPAADAGRARRAGPERSFERRASPSWGEGRSQDGSRPPPRRDASFQERAPVERTPTAAEMDNQWRARMKPDAPVSQTPTPEASTPSSPAPVPAAPATRPRLNLQKRTVSENRTDDAETTPSDAKASPFGAARPIDTAAREREVAEKRQAARQKKEEEDREREAQQKAEREKLAAEKAAKGETPTSPREPREMRPPHVNGRTASGSGNKKKSAAPATGPASASASASASATPTSGTAENGEKFTPNPGFSILQHMEDETGEDSRNMSANGEIISSADTEVKPREIVRDTNANAGGGGAEAETTAETLDSDGFQVVDRRSNRPQGKRRGGGGGGGAQPTRALAS